MITFILGYRRHTHKTEHYGKYRFKFDWEYDFYICPEKQLLDWKTPHVGGTGSTSVIVRFVVHAADEMIASANL